MDGVAGDDQQPGAHHGALRIEAVAALEGLVERHRGQVVGHGRVPHPVADVVVDAAEVLVVDAAEALREIRIPVAGGHDLEVGFHSVAPSSAVTVRSARCGYARTAGVLHGGRKAGR